MMNTFTWAAEQQNMVQEVEFQVLSAKLGDGYVQRVGKGMNSKDAKWSLVFLGRQQRIDEITEFLDEHAGWCSFLWTPPGQSTAIVTTCGAYSQEHQGADVWRLSATFEKGFQP
ncbi:phage tail protein [Alcaligenes sp. 1735tsa3]|jgi:phage-related protein|uniref:phage tail protein n=1 Tax=Alcaligenes TaxID=507 RepID=UPI0002D33228|nr:MULTISPECIES: phage tail protein [Alcaligenes]ERI33922.2 hypothetical protein N879_05085 [Alcaligenes sp. EGD-AK7]QCP82114.1 phage tail protein [Alcaligenes faecalis]ULH08263.1 phage tail protein [Alcaligenes faecalis]USY26855.1 phage tail protein [Alcaligenes sp. 1735tsa3]HRO20680.1 phage tail protein [Alcaligenes phenolicus]